MMPFQKENSPFRSSPVSRVASSTRLNQLAQESRGSLNNNSRPSTPTVYVSSSLNPSKYASTSQDNTDDKTRSSEELAAFNMLPIVSKIGDFRAALDTLSNGISHYKEDEFYTNVERIVETNTSLEKEIHELSKHKERGREVNNLSKHNKGLEIKLKEYLRELVQVRSELKKLPKTKNEFDSVSVDAESTADVESILNYSMKLAKFTKAPAAVGNLPFQIHPNNYIWPAEDSLRRGMLAMSSLHANEIIKSELSDGETTKEEEPEDVNEGVESNEPSKDHLARRDSHTSDKAYSSSQKEENVSQADLNLDLFDPDDEYSD
ncbi:MED4 [Candida margitis]|uniref:MED4 n=1 Tax=Candida margitis TaxID=1775924 RepID=UPI002225FC77|nr:MED4 [Candida margitis]KAI5950550.1 MED4 [Candida margitis]